MATLTILSAVRKEQLPKWAQMLAARIIPALSASPSAASLINDTLKRIINTINGGSVNG